MGGVYEKQKRAYARLRNAYAKGVIPYPRVDNSYEPRRSFRFYAHPPLPEFDEYSVPLKRQRYPFNKAALPVFLLNEGISTAATTLGILKFVDNLYDDNLSPRPGKEEAIRETIRRFRKHLARLEKRFGKSILDKSGRVHPDKVSYDGDASQMRMEIAIYSFPVEPRPEYEEAKRRVRKNSGKARRDRSINFAGGPVKNYATANLDEALEAERIRGVMLSAREAQKGAGVTLKKRGKRRRSPRLLGV